MNIRSLIVAVIASVSLAACGASSAEEEESWETTPVAEAEPAPEREPAAEPDPEDVHIEGDHITIDRHINFESGSDQILEDSNELLDHIATLISHHTDEVQHLRIVGHTDTDGSRQRNQALSERRAAAVVSALRSRGVGIELESAGAGETELLCQEETEECHAQNRRVEFIILPPTAGGEAESTDEAAAPEGK